MPELTSEERAQLLEQIPHFYSHPKYEYLAGKGMLAIQQPDISSFENPPFLTELRRGVFGLTKKEQRFIARQKELLDPFMQELELQNKVRSAVGDPTIGAALQTFPGLPIDPSQMMRPSIRIQGPGPGMITPKGMEVTRQINEEGLSALTPLSREYMSRQEPHYIEGPYPTGPGSPELNPTERLTSAQIPIYKQFLEGHLVAPGQEAVTPTLLAERERTAAGLLKPIEVSPGASLVDPRTMTTRYTAPELTKGPLAVSDENRIALEKYDKPYLKLTQPERTEVNKKLQELKITPPSALEVKREVEAEAKTRISRAFAFAGFKDSPFDAAGNIDVAKLLTPGAVDMDKLMYWAETAINEPGLSQPVKTQLQFFFNQIEKASAQTKKAAETPKAGSVLKFDKEGNLIK